MSRETQWVRNLYVAGGRGVRVKILRSSCKSPYPPGPRLPRSQHYLPRIISALLIFSEVFLTHIQAKTYTYINPHIIFILFSPLFKYKCTESMFLNT